jgi:hypothetical protein
MDAILPWYKEHNNGHHILVLVLFLRLRNSLNWILANPKSFFETLDELDDKTKKEAFSI